MSVIGGVFEVVFWEKTGDRSAASSGEPLVCFGWPMVSRMSRKWMARGENFFVSVSPRVAPFVEGREWYRRGIDRLCVTGAALTAESGSLDAPDYIPAGSCCVFVGSSGDEIREQSIASRGFWL